MKHKKFSIKPLVAAACLTLATAATAQSFSNTIFFGDSTSDNGRYKYIPSFVGGSLASQGAYTTNPGSEWTNTLGSKFGVAVAPSDAPGGGNDYAAGGARVSYTATNSNQVSAQSQVTAYLASTGGRADPSALYTVWIGGNDLGATVTGGLGNIVNPLNTAGIAELANQTVSIVAQLQAAGAKYILVPNLIGAENSTLTTALGSTFNSNLVTAKNLYTQNVWNGLSAQGINFIPGDINSAYNYVVANPAQFGLTNININTPACGTTTSAYNCGSANLVTPNANQTYLWADGPQAPGGGLHFTTAGQQIEADYFYNLLIAPGQISLLATEASINQAISNSVYLDQIGYSFRGQAPETLGAWVQGGYQQVNINNVGSSAPIGGAAGIDYQINENVLLGGYITTGQSTFNYNTNGSNFTQNSDSIGAYTGLRNNGFWINGLASYYYLNNTVNRNVPIGIASFNNTSTVNGSIISVATRTGYDFTWDRFTHGPMAGLAYQSTNINGFTESGNFTSLAFGSQTINATIASVGYQISYKQESWIPFVKVMYNNQSGTDNRQITTSLTTIAAPSYNMPAVAVGNNWTDLTAGIGYQVSKVHQARSV